MIILADFSVIKPDFGLIFWASFIFLLFWGLLAAFAFRPIISALKKREDDIQTSLDQAKNAKEEMANLKAENEKLLNEAREEKARILKEAKDAGEKIIKEAKEKAKLEAQKIVTTAKTEIENQRMAAVIDIKNQIGNIAIDVAEKILKKELAQDKAHSDFVKELISEAKLN